MVEDRNAGLRPCRRRQSEPRFSHAALDITFKVLTQRRQERCDITAGW